MANQNLIAMHDVSFLVVQLVLWYILTIFSHKRGSFALSVDVFKKIHQKLKSPNGYEM